jgi:hypothetical protein
MVKGFFLNNANSAGFVTLRDIFFPGGSVGLVKKRLRIVT